MTLRVMLAGQEAAGAQILRSLTSSAHEVVAVLTQEPADRSGPASLTGQAERADVSVLPASLVRDAEFAETIRSRGVDVLLNAHSLHIISDEVLAAPRIGSFNLHPGPLPEYAGLNTVGWAICNGEAHYGVTVHWMLPRIDAGPIAFEQRFPVGADATALTLSAECTRRGVPLLARVLEHAERDPRSIPARPQDLSARVYYARDRIPQAGYVDWTRSGEEIARFARAFDYGPFSSPWGRPYFVVGHARVEVAGIARTGERAHEPPGTHRLGSDETLRVAARDEWMRLGRLFVHGEPVEPRRLAEAIREERVGRGGAT